MLRKLLDMEIPWEENKCIWRDDEAAYGLYELNTQWDYCMEGYLLAHCLGTKDVAEFNESHKALSLRDKLGISHATVLLQRDGTWSPYGQSADLCSDMPVFILGEPYYVLQVRGREDALARWEYYKLIRYWYLSNGGSQKIRYEQLQKLVVAQQDKDMKYHYGYLLDEGRNMFNWAAHNRETRTLFQKLGLSL